jgi:hypothetical protein
MVARHGEHFGFEVKQFVKTTPSRPTRSMFGVLIQLQPKIPAWPLPQSSAMTKRMLGRFAD